LIFKNARLFFGALGAFFDALGAFFDLKQTFAYGAQSEPNVIKTAARP
jgi:hypothetical protein